jgi:uncharacterized membrane protein YoaK (UPF0700 family)
MINRQVNLVLVALTVATASLDVTSFLRLGSVFASVMTSNLIFVSIAAVKANATLAKQCGVAIAGYVLGVALGSAVAPPSGRENRLGTRRLNLLLTGEAVLVLGYAAWWMAEDAQPKGATQLVLLAAVTIAMGAQGAAARQLGDPNAGTTYMTGTLTGLVSSLVGRRHPDTAAVLGILALLAGAGASAGLIALAPVAVPLLAVAGIGLAAAVSWRYGRETHFATDHLALRSDVGASAGRA